MEYAFYIICFLFGFSATSIGIKCFTDTGRSKLIEDRKRSLKSMIEFSTSQWSLMGFITMLIGILFIASSIKFAITLGA